MIRNRSLVSLNLPMYPNFHLAFCLKLRDSNRRHKSTIENPASQSTVTALLISQSSYRRWFWWGKCIELTLCETTPLPKLAHWRLSVKMSPTDRSRFLECPRCIIQMCCTLAAKVATKNHTSEMVKAFEHSAERPRRLAELQRCVSSFVLRVLCLKRRVSWGPLQSWSWHLPFTRCNLTKWERMDVLWRPDEMCRLADLSRWHQILLTESLRDLKAIWKTSHHRYITIISISISQKSPVSRVSLRRGFQMSHKKC